MIFRYQIFTFSESGIAWEDNFDVLQRFYLGSRKIKLNIY